jgi:hypothetical protein
MQLLRALVLLACVSSSGVVVNSYRQAQQDLTTTPVWVQLLPPLQQQQQQHVPAAWTQQSVWQDAAAVAATPQQVGPCARVCTLA